MTTVALEKKCYFCAEVIKAEAIKCKHCGSFVGENREAPQQVQPSRTDVAILVALLAVPFIVGALSLMWYNGLPAAERAKMERVTQEQ